MKIGDCYIGRRLDLNKLIIKILTIKSDKNCWPLEVENLCDKHYLNKYYKFDQKLTDEQTIKDIIE